MKLLGAVVLSALWMTLASSLAGCGREAQGAPADHRARRASPSTSLPHADRRTTNGATALRNLDAQIDAGERQLALHPGDVRSSAALAAVLLARAEVRGRIADLERVAALADDALAEHPDDPAAYLLAATAASRLHRFDDALAALDEAARRGAPAAKVAAARAGIRAAQGELDEALPSLEAAARARPGLETTGALAAAVADTGDLPRARRLFAEALAAYRDVSPLAVGWLELQEGLADERAGDTVEAARFYRRVLERLPGHAQAAQHLAALEAREGRREAAIALLEPLVRTSDDPEPVGQLANLYRAVGRTADADRLRAAAAARYAELLARAPEAFADHAARFRLEVEGDAAGALALAEQNLRVRHTAAAVELAVTAALAAHEDARACALGRTYHLPEDLRGLAADACGPHPN